METKLVGCIHFEIKLWRLTLAQVTIPFSIVVAAAAPPPPPPLSATAEFSPETVGTPVLPTDVVAASGGVPPYTYEVVGGSLPPGVTLDPNLGTLSGTPTTAGTATGQIQVTDSAGASSDAKKA
jgi:hypothetical protein